MSETSFKFFIQFVVWTALYCIFSLVVTSYFLAEYKREVSKDLPNIVFTKQILYRRDRRSDWRSRVNQGRGKQYCRYGLVEFPSSLIQNHLFRLG